MSHHIPDYRILINDKNVTDLFNGRLISLTLRDERGNKADQLDISLDDSDSLLPLPEKKAIIKVWLGFKQPKVSLPNLQTTTPLTFKGSFVVDEITYSNQSSIDTLKITARSADFKGPLKVKREQSWHQISLVDLVQTIAAQNKLTPRISDTLATTLIDHIDQTDESDISFLNRLAKRYDAICTIKDNNLLFAEIGNATTVSGKPLPILIIDKRETSSYTYQTQDRDGDYSGVQSYWNDKKYAKRKTVLAGSDENPKVLRSTYPSEQQATEAAKAEWKKLNRNQASFSVDLTVGNPDALPEMPVMLTGFKEQIIVQKWGIESVEHVLTDKGLAAQVNLSYN
ncbi:MAG: phage late control D family protein [Oceanospirillaceae bacterium]|nr:phage late control D family protein [Oceanospirillaceae bacterium]